MKLTLQVAVVAHTSWPLTGVVRDADQLPPGRGGVGVVSDADVAQPRWQLCFFSFDAGEIRVLNWRPSGASPDEKNAVLGLLQSKANGRRVVAAP